MIGSDVAKEVAALKGRLDGNIVVLGSGELVRTLAAHDLVDEYFLVIFPILLGSGNRLFGATEQPTRLTLVDCKDTATGGVMLTYRRGLRQSR